jgi:hypothetical protein
MDADREGVVGMVFEYVAGIGGGRVEGEWIVWRDA